ncbi:hypothetical protein LWI29_009211 [Acer saccharum]|uniref:Uncharacterized protein n=1 Tax=Acer saccharum TaxID=4024 RepID=A0AA39SK89_ACESA|nr:hypothetical protein LWI29_009211 [Acer saccharum]
MPTKGVAQPHPPRATHLSFALPRPNQPRKQNNPVQHQRRREPVQPQRDFASVIPETSRTKRILVPAKAGEESGGFIGGGFWCSRTGLSTCYSVSFISRNEGAYHPIELAKLKNLTQFRINDNNFNGRIPDFIQNWKGLRGLKIRGSGLKGPIPSSISVLKITRTIED